MRICQVMASCGDVGGLEKHCAELCNGLSEKNEVMVVADERYRELFSKNVRFEAMDMGRSRYHPSGLWELRRIVKRSGVDIVHAQANKAATMVRVATWGLKCKTVATVHGLKKHTRMYDGFDRVIAVSKGVGERVKNTRVDVIYNGIAMSELPDDVGHDYLRRVVGIDASGLVAVSVGRLVDVKGFDVLLRAWVGVDADLIIVGDGPERKMLEEMIGDLGLVGRVWMVGYRDDVPAILASADMMVISSRREGFPYVMTEALLVKQVIVSTRVPGASEILPRGYLVKYENHTELHKAIVGHLARLDEAKQDFEPMWDLAKRELTVEHMVMRTEEIYSKTLGEN